MPVCHNGGGFFLPRATMTWSYIISIFRQHRKTLVFANVIALLSAAISIPAPLLMPLLVDEVLLDKPAELVHAMQWLFQ